MRFVFQPAEEGPGGALPMIREGILNDPPIEAAFGLHLWSGLPTGKIAVTSGPMMAGPDEFELIVRGRGGHGAYPHTAVDAVVVASHIVVAMQTVVSRSIDPIQTAVVSIGMFNSGSNFNIIAETARLRARSEHSTPRFATNVIRRVREVADGICATFGATCEFVVIDHYPPTVNDPAMADFVAGIAAEVVGPENVIRDLVSMGGEDMSYFLREVPGAFFFLGAGDASRGIVHPHHSPHFDFDESAMQIGVEVFLRIMDAVLDRVPTAAAEGRTDSVDLILVRHGDAESAGPMQTDAARRLTVAGEHAAAQTGRTLAELGVGDPRIVSSPKARALETARILARELRVDPPMILAILQGDTTIEGIVAALAQAKSECLIVVGHMPDLGELAAHLLDPGVSGAVSIPTAGYVWLALDGLPPGAPGRLRTFGKP